MKYFVVSDIHSNYYALRDALEQKGFDETNPNHTLIVAGDLFDRGSEPSELLWWILGLERKVLIRGNHDMMLEQCFDEEAMSYIGALNGVDKTIAGLMHGDVSVAFNADYDVTADILSLKQYSHIKEWRKQLVNYFEVDDIVITHAWAPVRYKECDRWDWQDIHWTNSINAFYNARFQYGCALPNKTLIIGHFHARTFWNSFEGKKCDLPFEKDGLIAIDGCTCGTGVVNVLTIENGRIEYDR